MAVASTAEDVASLNSSEPLLLQEFIPHYGVLFKIFVVGSNFHVVARPSIQVSLGLPGCVEFDSQRMLKQFGQSRDHLSDKLQLLQPDVSLAVVAEVEARLDHGVLARIVAAIAKAMVASQYPSRSAPLTAIGPVFVRIRRVDRRKDRSSFCR